MSVRIRVRDVETTTESQAYRTALKFGGVRVSHATILTVKLRLEASDGRFAWGSGSMPMGNVWAFPSKRIPPEVTQDAMLRLAQEIARRLPEIADGGHPVEIGHRAEVEWFELAAHVSRAMNLVDPMPRLCAMVVASPFDAAIHDAYGRLHGLHVYDCYGQDYLPIDLSHFLDSQFRGEYLPQYTRPRPKPRMPLYHLIGAIDALTASDVREPLTDGLPNTLGEWIARDQLTHLKIKLNGNDAKWDIERILGIDRAASEAQASRKCDTWAYSLDFNEQCPNVDYLLEVLTQVQSRNRPAFDRVAYVEQPTARDLRANPENKMHAAARIKPVVIDESLVDYESLLLAREQGYSGVALKACKGQTQSLLMAAAAQKFGMFLCVQDLTCPGQSFLHSAGLAAHIPSVTAIEGNARQYCPNANLAWSRRYPDAFRVENGLIDTSRLSAVGLGHDWM